MYKNIYIPVDNSKHSNAGIEIGIDLSKKFNASYTGSHVYAAALHDSRFKQMEGGLPEKYKEEDELFKQREVHDTLIDQGLRVISDSFLDVFEQKCTAKGIAYNRTVLEGKNFHVLVQDINDNNYDLVIIGALGLGAVKDSIIGSVCERVTRRIKTDILIVKDTEPLASGKKIVVAVDGSPQSFAGLKQAITMAKAFDLTVDVISAFDPYYHYVAFNSIVKVLSEKDSEVFKFEEQEKLHEEIIDSGLAKIYKTNLDLAEKIAKKENFTITTHLLDGKAFEKILTFVRETKPWLLVMGRIGIHSEKGMDIGSSTENLLRLSPCNLLITKGEFKLAIEISDIEKSMPWTKESVSRMTRVPSFARGMAKKAIYEYAVENGYTIITSDIIDKVMEKFMPSSAKGAMEQIINKKKADSIDITWTKEAKKRINELCPKHLRSTQMLRVEKYARITNQFPVQLSMVDKIVSQQSAQAANSPAPYPDKTHTTTSVSKQHRI